MNFKFESLKENICNSLIFMPNGQEANDISKNSKSGWNRSQNFIEYQAEEFVFVFHVCSIATVYDNDPMINECTCLRIVEIRKSPFHKYCSNNNPTSSFLIKNDVLTRNSSDFSHRKKNSHVQENEIHMLLAGI